MDQAGRSDDRDEQRELGRLRAGVILRAHVQGWPALALDGVTVSSGAGSWASFLESAGKDELAAALAALGEKA